jgi:hypothetical protein
LHIEIFTQWREIYTPSIPPRKGELEGTLANHNITGNGYENTKESINSHYSYYPLACTVNDNKYTTEWLQGMGWQKHG